MLQEVLICTDICTVIAWKRNKQKILQQEVLSLSLTP